MTAPAPARGRPWALTVLWILLMAPASLAGPLLQAHLRIDDRALPLVMVGPALAWAVCRLAVPRWFPSDETASRQRAVPRAWVATALTCLAFVAVLLMVTPDSPPVLPSGPRPVAVLAVVLGLGFGSWCEEIGFRGTMYRALSTRLGPLTAIVLNGLFFGLCHVQYLGSGLDVATFLTTTVLLDIAMVAAWDGPWRQRVAMASVVHAVVNIALQLRGVEVGPSGSFTPFLAAMGAAALVALVAGRLLGVGDLGGRRPVRRPSPAVAATDTLGA